MKGIEEVDLMNDYTAMSLTELLEEYLNSIEDDEAIGVRKRNRIWSEFYRRDNLEVEE